MTIEIMKIKETIENIRKRCNEGQMNEADLIVLCSILSPEGTKDQRHMCLIEVARAMGFEDAEPAYWDERDPERGATSPEEHLDYNDTAVCDMDIGIYLHASVTAVGVADEDGLFDNVEVLDDRTTKDATP